MAYSGSSSTYALTSYSKRSPFCFSDKSRHRCWRTPPTRSIHESLHVTLFVCELASFEAVIVDAPLCLFFRWGDPVHEAGAQCNPRAVPSKTKNREPEAEQSGVRRGAHAPATSTPSARWTSPTAEGSRGQSVNLALS